MSIVEKMIERYNASWDASKEVTLENIPVIRHTAMLAAITATGLTEAQLEGLANGTMVVVDAADLVEVLKVVQDAKRAIEAAREGNDE